MTTDSERERILEQIRHLVNYVQRGEAWRLKSIELDVTRLIREIRSAETDLYNKISRSYGGTD